MKKTRELHLLETPEGLWQGISIDIIGLLPKSNNKNAIVVIIDWFTKLIRLKTTIITVSLEDIAKRPQFVSRFIENLGKTLGTKRTLSMAYHS